MLYPDANRLQQFSQEELRYLAVVSRRRAYQALKALGDTGPVRNKHGGINVLAVEDLRRIGD